MSDLTILGVMTGTSCDGLDAACIRVDLQGWEQLWNASVPYPAALRERVLEVQKPKARMTNAEWLALDRDLGDFYAAAVGKVLRGRAPYELPEVIANHGQTIAHFPAPANRGTTLQMGDPTRIARATGLTTVAQFRQGDMAAGGQGAPLLPRFHILLAGHLAKVAPGPGIAIHNLGGISNLTYIGADRVLAFDTGPANIWIDLAAAAATDGRLKMDKGGKLGRAGRVDEAAVAKILKHPYFRKPAPKSTGRDDFPWEFFRSRTKARGADLVATATAVTVESAARAYEEQVLSEGLPLSAVFVCGGGARNPFLMDSLARRLPNVRIGGLEEQGLDAQFIEAQGFALFGFLGLLGQPIGGEWTGAEGFAPPAHVVPGENWIDVVSRIGEIIAESR